MFSLLGRMAGVPHFGIADACRSLRKAASARRSSDSHLRNRNMATETGIPQSPAAAARPRDGITKLYRKIGISAVAAALEAAKPSQNRKDHPADAMREAA